MYHHRLLSTDYIEIIKNINLKKIKKLKETKTKEIGMNSWKMTLN